jgi:hypothetical protein
MPHAYPQQLADLVRQRWVELHAGAAGARGADAESGSQICSLPEPPALEQILSTVYQATLLREEERPVTFRLIVGAPQSFAPDAGPPFGLHRLVFTQPRPLTEHELRRLSPAAKYHRSLIGVDKDADGEYVIWGVLQSGPRWLDSVRGGRRSNPTLPASKLVVRATGPGRVAVASGSVTLGELRGGSVSASTNDLFDSKWLSAMFRREREEVGVLHGEARKAAPEPWADLDEDLTRMLSQQMVKRIISTMRSIHHGGMLVLLPSEGTEDVMRELLNLKYAFEDAEPRRRFRTLILAVMRSLAQSHSEPVGWSAYGSSDNRELASLDEAVFEVSHLIAGLADVDGAVVMNKRFEVLGFGCEILGGVLPEVRKVRRALDLEGSEHEEETVEGVGTRHRSAYRLCSRVHDALVVVVSHDGTVRFVTWKDGAVTYWDHVSVGSPEG